MGKEANSNIERKSLYLDGMMGLVVGDALGVPVEFSSREEREQDPVKEMRGYGTYPVAKGSWSDDSSMALASLKALQDYGISLTKTMDNFVAWEQDGQFTPSGEVFDEGNTCSMAIYDYMKSKDVSTCGQRDENSNGNRHQCVVIQYLLPSTQQQHAAGSASESGIKCSRARN